MRGYQKLVRDVDAIKSAGIPLHHRALGTLFPVMSLDCQAAAFIELIAFLKLYVMVNGVFR